MRSFRFFVFFFFISGLVNAQNGKLVIFCQDNVPFKVIINGLDNSTTFSNRSVIENLPPTMYKVRVVFEDQKLEEIDEAIKISAGRELTYEISKRNIAEPEKKIKVIGQNMARDFWLKEKEEAEKEKEEILSKDYEYNLKYLSSLPLAVEKTKEIVPNTTPDSPTETSKNNEVKENVNSLEVATIDANIGNMVNMDDNVVLESDVKPILPGYSGKTACPIPVGENAFAEIKKTISSLQKGELRLKQTEKLLKSNCLLCTQVREVLLMFDFEEDRLSLAKTAYSSTFDIDNYPSLFDLFTFQSSTTELEKFINLMK